MIWTIQTGLLFLCTTCGKKMHSVPTLVFNLSLKRPFTTAFCQAYRGECGYQSQSMQGTLSRKTPLGKYSKKKKNQCSLILLFLYFEYKTSPAWNVFSYQPLNQIWQVCCIRVNWIQRDLYSPSTEAKDGHAFSYLTDLIWSDCYPERKDTRHFLCWLKYSLMHW